MGWKQPLQAVEDLPVGPRLVPSVEVLRLLQMTVGAEEDLHQALRRHAIAGLEGVQDGPHLGSGLIGRLDDDLDGACHPPQVTPTRTLRAQGVTRPALVLDKGLADSTTKPAHARKTFRRLICNEITIGSGGR